VRISDDGQTVLDEVTGLAWQRKPNTTSYTSFAKARAYCEGLALDGHADWRLPGFIELASLFPADQIGTYDPKVFPDGLPSYLFTASPVQNEAQSGTASSHIWVVDTKEPRPYVEPMEPTPFPYSALCVRTASIPEVGLPDARFQADAVHDSVQDLRTGLVWQRTVEDLPRTFEQARSYCGALRQAGADTRRGAKHRRRRRSDGPSVLGVSITAGPSLLDQLELIKSVGDSVGADGHAGTERSLGLRVSGNRQHVRKARRSSSLRADEVIPRSV
jgi:hypothetical protein